MLRKRQGRADRSGGGRRPKYQPEDKLILRKFSDSLTIIKTVIPYVDRNGMFGFGKKSKHNKKDRISEDETQDVVEDSQLADSDQEDPAETRGAAGKGENADRFDEDSKTAKASDSSDVDESDDAPQNDGSSDDDSSDNDDSSTKDNLLEPTGPWDIDDPDAPDYDEMVNLGAFYLPVISGAELRLKAAPSADPSDPTIIGATLTLGDSSLELEAFAAPKTMGLWEDIRQELLDSNPQASEEEGTFGQEVTLPVTVKGKTYISLIVGVDGPRWMLRGIFTGPAASSEGQEWDALSACFSDIVVDRGQEPLAPRDLLPMTLPQPPKQEDDEDEDWEEKAQEPVKPDGYGVQTTVQTSLTRGPLFSELR